MLPGWCCIANRHIGARERRQLIPHVHFQVPFLGSESQLKSGFACAGLFCSNSIFYMLVAAKLRGIRGKKKKEIRNGAGEIRIWGIAWIGTSPQGKIKKFTLENDHVAYVESVFLLKNAAVEPKIVKKCIMSPQFFHFFALSNSGVTFL